MLTTRCPTCETVFRITASVLHQADGQVRCGQCTTVFGAFDSLTDTTTGLSQSVVTRALTQPPIDAHEPTAEFGSHAQFTQEELDEVTHSTELANAADSVPSAEPEALDAAIEPELSPLDMISEQQVDEVLETVDAASDEVWQLPDFPPAEQAPTTIWRWAVAFALLVLTIQGIHHYRADIVKLAYVGPWLDSAYTLLGRPIYPNVSPAEFEIVNWLATAEESDNLAITAGIRNVSSSEKAYPLLFLELTDRWDNRIAKRVFTPQDYLPGQISAAARISPGATINAQLNLVDPGSDAYGFEVDICTESSAATMRCKSDLPTN